MKVFFTCLLSMFIVYGFAQKVSVSIPPGESVELDYPGYEVYEAKINSKTPVPLDIKVLRKTDGSQVSGFGLGNRASAKIRVRASAKLSITNPSNSTANLDIKINPNPPAPDAPVDPNQMISFTLENTSSESIPLLIPSVMNPNLSPNSKSGVDLKIGQEILFREKGKKHVLLVVDGRIEEGAVIDVAALLGERRKELGLIP